jgi:hypothetical protein
MADDISGWGGVARPVLEEVCVHLNHKWFVRCLHGLVCRSPEEEEARAQSRARLG